MSAKFPHCLMVNAHPALSIVQLQTDGIKRVDKLLKKRFSTAPTIDMHVVLGGYRSMYHIVECDDFKALSKVTQHPMVTGTLNKKAPLCNESLLALRRSSDERPPTSKVLPAKFPHCLMVNAHPVLPSVQLQMDGIKRVDKLLKKRFSTAPTIDIHVVLGGYRSIYHIVEYDDFKDLFKVTQHPMVTDTLNKKRLYATNRYWHLDVQLQTDGIKRVDKLLKKRFSTAPTIDMHVVLGGYRSMYHIVECDDFKALSKVTQHPMVTGTLNKKAPLCNESLLALRRSSDERPPSIIRCVFGTLCTSNKSCLQEYN
ncbi:unnamed protein product [Toxocara canis]|uniref:Uncharacterized protein n=1 Tax=Toxocara canis TaxID=6265 RepID=A0A3P7GE65_TOXCA|nr:unnamed protein product [Toxocara canis]